VSYTYFQRSCRECNGAYVSRHENYAHGDMPVVKLLSHKCDHMDIWSQSTSQKRKRHRAELHRVPQGAVVTWNERIEQ